ncbi:P-type conjugative transfer protein VirB9 [Sphingomonas crocodyli]|uniref:P-type conjugative transfer protein VirB9 n=1 Tax=Sphingomonas crocodyli TaxID=1979270 RepID=A0A437LY78_9SPHN|nr:P-type conjugative transfer protein VirB9 [Sphingomonas crocodyli]RVT90296.1 P-type conjugative transfer protein VirB9 [Sphingomonas crocodyli]
MIRPFVIALLIAASTPVFSAETPHPGTADPRITWVNYNPAQVYRVVGTFRSATQVLFGPGEEIAHVALGDTISWEVAPAGNILFIKPRERAGPTNLIVTTRREGEVRNYQFELVARSGGISVATPNTFFQIGFRYPQDEARRAALVQAQKLVALERGAIRLALDHGAVTGPRNMAYTVQGASALQPSEVSDNGQFTVLRFPNRQELPAIFVVAPDGSESLVPYDVRDDFVVIHQIAREFRLRRGRIVLCIYNEGPATYGIDHHTATASPDVDRSLKQEPR